jgi:general secretion pathway protein G
MKPSGNVAAIAALGLLVLYIGVTTRMGTTGKPRNWMTKQLLSNVSRACNQYYLEHGESPASLVSLTNNPKGIAFMHWGKEGTNDGWRHPIHFKPYDASLGYGSITSYGRDGRPGGDGDDADLEVRFEANQR